MKKIRRISEFLAPVLLGAPVVVGSIAVAGSAASVVGSVAPVVVGILICLGAGFIILASI